MNSCAKNGGAPRRRFSDIGEKSEGGVFKHPPPGPARVKTAVQWAPHSPDLSPLDFFLWGFLKDRVYTSKPKTTGELKDAIVMEVSRLPSQMIDDTITHLQTVRLPTVIRRKGAHVEHPL